MNENSEKNISGNPDSQNRNITDDQLQIDTQLQDANRQGPLRSASSGLDMQFATALDRLTMPTPFTSQLRYDNPAHGATPGTPGLAGNITEWKTFRNGSTANGSTYAFTYDLMSRLKSSSRYAGNSATATSPYTEKDITYFADSRIKTMKRYGASASSVQSLSFATDTNTYDSFRNVTNDATSGTSIEWNILNLPRKMTTSGGVVSEYTYLADGAKVRMKSGTTTLHYLGSMVFSQAGSASPVFESMAFSEGRIVVNSSGSKEVHYHISDHLGSVRSVVKADGTVIAANDYYPYGKRINTASATAPTQRDRHTFSGKEDQALTPGGAPYLDFGARMYSAETGRWLSVDPMAEKYYGIGTNVYCAGNPINLVDTKGLDIWRFNVKGELVDNIHNNNNDIFVVVQQNEYGSWKEIDGSKVVMPFGSVSQHKDNSLLFSIQDNSQAKNVFETMANNTSVEWSYVSYSDGRAAEVGTNSKADSNKTMIESVKYRESVLDEVIHSHPTWPYPSSKDKQFYGELMNNAGSNRNNILVKLYYVLSGDYISYNENGPIYDSNLYECF